ncbi:MAG TPA: succinate dehydrogenase assembly factor 2 [Caulobacteraceae bacterium]|jgi:antitoxin CptB
MSPADEVRLKRARLRAWRRGFREADLILGPFADTQLGAMGDEALGQFERLLEANDAEVYAWIVGTAPAPAEFDTEVMTALRKSIETGK